MVSFRKVARQRRTAQAEMRAGGSGAVHRRKFPHCGPVRRRDLRPPAPDATARLGRRETPRHWVLAGFDVSGRI
jgi:hypothetical protein